MGRIMTRANTLNVLQARLQIQDTFKRHPEIADEEIKQPYIIGQGRSGTSMLHNILSAIPENGTTLEWEPMFPCPPPEKDTYRTDTRIETAEHLITMHVRAAPGIASMHEFGARIPSEIGQVQALTMKSSRT